MKFYFIYIHIECAIFIHLKQLLVSDNVLISFKRIYIEFKTEKEREKALYLFHTRA